MPIPISDALDAHEAAAVTKARQARDELPKYLLNSMMAGAYCRTRRAPARVSPYSGRTVMASNNAVPTSS